MFENGVFIHYLFQSFKFFIYLFFKTVSNNAFHCNSPLPSLYSSSAVVHGCQPEGPRFDFSQTLGLTQKFTLTSQARIKKQMWKLLFPSQASYKRMPYTTVLGNGAHLGMQLREKPICAA